MSNQYDSVLKEKKKYEEVIDDRHFLRKHALAIDFLVVVVILLISFIIYFFKVLSPSKMIYDDVMDFLNYTSAIYKNLDLDYDFKENYHFEGDVSIETDSNYDNKDDMNLLKNLNFNYSLLINDEHKMLDINSDSYDFTYYEDSKNGYYNIKDKYILYDLVKDNSLYFINQETKTDISNFLTNELNKINFKKSAFISNGELVASVEFSLTGKEVKDMLNNFNSDIYNYVVDKNLISDTIKYEFTIKDEIFSNDLIDLKVVIKQGDYRGVLTYQDGTFEYSDDNHNYKGVLKVDGNDFSFRFYEGDDMKFIISGKGSNNSYIYTYQVINIVDNLSLQVKRDDSENLYTLNIKKENEDKYVNLLASISLKYDNNVNFKDLEFLKQDFKAYTELDDKEKDTIDNDTHRLSNALTNLFEYVK